MGDRALKHNSDRFFRQVEDPISRFFISIAPAVIVAFLCYLLGPDVYLPVISVFLSFFFAVGLGWIASPIIGISMGMNPFILVILLVFISSQSSLIVGLNYELLESIPLLGTGMKKTRKRAGELIEKKKLGEEAGYLSIFWLMFLPLYGTGPLVMTLVGRLLDFNWKKVWATITFSALTRFSLITGLIYLGHIG